MPLIDFEFLEKSVPQELASVRIGIETGTCFGGSTRLMARRLEQVYTVELSPELQERTRGRMHRQGYRNVQFLQGNSGTELAALLATLGSRSEPILFFLDAHWSGDRSVSWGAPSRAGFKGYGVDTAHLGAPGALPRPEEQTPILDELRAIMTHCNGPALVLIDDMQILPEDGQGAKDWGFPGEDWSHLSRQGLLELVRPRLKRRFEKRTGRTEQILLLLGPGAG